MRSGSASASSSTSHGTVLLCGAEDGNAPRVRRRAGAERHDHWQDFGGALQPAITKTPTGSAHVPTACSVTLRCSGESAYSSAQQGFRLCYRPGLGLIPTTACCEEDEEGQERGLRIQEGVMYEHCNFHYLNKKGNGMEMRSGQDGGRCGIFYCLTLCTYVYHPIAMMQKKWGQALRKRRLPQGR